MSVSGDKRSSTKISVGQQMTINMKMEITTSAVHDGLLITTGIQANNDRNRNRSVDIGLLSPDQNPQMWNWWRKQTGNVPVAVEDSTFLPLANGRTNDEVLNPQKSMSSILPSSPERHIHSPSRLEHVETTENYFAQRKTVSENCTLDNNGRCCF
jgi:hypothetical protein